MMENEFNSMGFSAEEMIGKFTWEISSKLPINQVHEKVSDACEEKKFALSQTYVYHDIVEGKGFPIDRKVYIYEICQAKTAAGMLADFPRFALFMPCRIAVYEKDGETVLATMNMGSVLDAVRSDAQLFNEATTLYATVKDMLATLAGK